MSEIFNQKYINECTDPRKRLFYVLSIRQIWHMIFDFAPTLQANLAGNHQKKVFNQFLEYFDTKGLNISWQLPILFYNFMSIQIGSNQKIRTELRVNALRKWVILDQSSNIFLNLFFQNEPIFFRVRKATGFDALAKVEILQCSELISKKSLYFITKENIEIEDLFSLYNGHMLHE